MLLSEESCVLVVISSFLTRGTQTCPEPQPLKTEPSEPSGSKESKWQLRLVTSESQSRGTRPELGLFGCVVRRYTLLVMAKASKGREAVVLVAGHSKGNESSHGSCLRV